MNFVEKIALFLSTFESIRSQLFIHSIPPEYSIWIEESNRCLFWPMHWPRPFNLHTVTFQVTRDFLSLSLSLSVCVCLFLLLISPTRINAPWNYSIVIDFPPTDESHLTFHSIQLEIEFNLSCWEIPQSNMQIEYLAGSSASSANRHLRWPQRWDARLPPRLRAS